MRECGGFCPEASNSGRKSSQSHEIGLARVQKGRLYVILFLFSLFSPINEECRRGGGVSAYCGSDPSL